MSASASDYQELFGSIVEDVFSMPRCACVICNSCTCACSCRAIPEYDELDW